MSEEPQVIKDLMALIDDARRCTRVINGQAYTVGKSIESSPRRKNTWVIWTAGSTWGTHYVWKERFYRTKANALRALENIV